MLGSFRNLGRTSSNIPILTAVLFNRQQMHHFSSHILNNTNRHNWFRCLRWLNVDLLCIEKQINQSGATSPPVNFTEIRSFPRDLGLSVFLFGDKIILQESIPDLICSKLHCPFILELYGFISLGIRFSQPEGSRKWAVPHLQCNSPPVLPLLHDNFKPFRFWGCALPGLELSSLLHDGLPSICLPQLAC